MSMPLVLFNPVIGPYQVLPLRVRVDRGAMSMKVYSVFPKVPASLEPHHQIVWCHIRTLIRGCRRCIKLSYITIPKSDIGIMVRMFANGLGDMGSIPDRKTQKMVLDVSLLSTQHYKVRVKGKVEQSRERSSASPTPPCNSCWKGSILVTLDYGRQQLTKQPIRCSRYRKKEHSTMIANFTLQCLVVSFFNKNNI